MASDTAVNLAADEKVIRTFPYQRMWGKKYEQRSTLTLTNKRIIHKSVEKFKDTTQTYSSEIPLDDVDSLDYVYHYKRKPMNIVVKVVLLILAIFGVVLIYSGNMAAESGASTAGIVIVCAAVLIFVLCLIFRKKENLFYLKACRISYMRTSSHLQFGSFKMRGRNQRGKGQKGLSGFLKGRAAGILAVIALICVLIVLMLEGAETLGNNLPYALLAVIFLIVLVSVAVSKRGKNDNGDSEIGKPHFVVTNLKKSVDAEAVLALINEIGALTLENKKPKSKYSDIQ